MNRNDELPRIAVDEASEERLLREAAEISLAYLRESKDAPPYPEPAAVERARSAGAPLPERPTSPQEVLRELAEVYGPATVRSHSGRYFGFVHGSSFPIGLAAKWVSTVWDQNTPLFALSPAASLLENEVERWMVELLGLPQGSAVGFVSSTSQSLLTALFAARQSLLERLGWCARARGLRGAPKIRVVMGEQAHVAVRRALNILGFGEADLEIVPADNQGRISPAALPALDDRTLLILQAGNIYTGAFDAFSEILPLARRAGAWTHVDGAFGLWAAASPGRRALVRGIDEADSWSADCHKTLNTPFSCGLVLCRDRALLRKALASHGSYLSQDEERNGMDYSPDMARRCAVAEVWATMKALGREGVATLVEGLCENARAIAEGLGEAGYVVANEIAFNQVTVRLETDDATERALARIQNGGVAWCGAGLWQGRKVIRISVSSWRTTPADVAETVAAFAAAR